MNTEKRHTCIRCKKKKDEPRMKVFGSTFLGTHWICNPAKLKDGWWRKETCEPVEGSLWNTLVEQLGILLKLFVGTKELTALLNPAGSGSQPAKTSPAGKKSQGGGTVPAPRRRGLKNLPGKKVKPG